ncbi:MULTISPECIES: 3D domain-containing protein [Bacillus]|uniref:Peptidoglycan-binding protein n=2 Tax=Bacillus TaxID=1386 RepID=A0A0M3R9E8_9BACI|nr:MULTISPECIES: 3D domain-containing protein [Bacillus]ALC81296.1 peptidoglycan-binding protein [Bacillus gobiensis]MBP1080307.1 3D (Asp-Asp-Asp) domain-containing protein [Bacillus capparidis]MED1094170.1 LysM peptidoglycan-binding domain-containing protein [Bacillus capparidis]
MKKTIMSFIAVTAISTTAVGANSAFAKEEVVKEGDTLWGISEKHGVDLKDLKEWNKLSSDFIKPGDKLTISSEKNEQYNIEEGDSLWKIAEKFNVSIEDLVEWNGLNSDIIHAGQTLSVSGQAQADAGEAPSEPQPSEPVKQEEAEAPKAAPEENNTSDQQAATKELTVTATAYTADCEGCSGVTATGKDLKADPNAKVIAVDPSVIPLGTKVEVEGYGEAVASDTGGAIKGNKIDVFVPSKDEAQKWGSKQVKVKILN